MTKNDFQRRYHDYQTRDRRAALDEAAKVNDQADDFTVVVLEFPPFGYALMLAEAAAFLPQCGVNLTPETDEKPE